MHVADAASIYIESLSHASEGDENFINSGGGPLGIRWNDGKLTLPKTLGKRGRTCRDLKGRLIF